MGTKFFTTISGFVNKPLVGHFTIRKIGTGLIRAVVLGNCVGFTYKHCKENPGTGMRIAKFSLAAGVAGGMLGFGLAFWQRRFYMLGTITQALNGSIVVGTYLTINSILTINKPKIPFTDRQLKPSVVSAISGGVSFGLVQTLAGINKNRIPLSIGGMLFGVTAHYVYNKLREKRIEYMVKEQYPDVYKQMKESEEWVNDQVESNPFYAGPILNKSKLDFLGDLWTYSAGGQHRRIMGEERHSDP